MYLEWRVNVISILRIRHYLKYQVRHFFFLINIAFLDYFLIARKMKNNFHFMTSGVYLSAILAQGF